MPTGYLGFYAGTCIRMNRVSYTVRNCLGGKAQLVRLGSHISSTG